MLKEKEGLRCGGVPYSWDNVIKCNPEPCINHLWGPSIRAQRYFNLFRSTSISTSFNSTAIMGTFQRYYSSTSSLLKPYQTPKMISFRLCTALNSNPQATRSLHFRICEFSTTAYRWRSNRRDTDIHQNTMRFEGQSPPRMIDGTSKDQLEKH
jgi:hypothetical protein